MGTAEMRPARQEQAWLDERAQPVASAEELARLIERSGMGRAATELVEDRPLEHTQQLYAPVIFEGASSRQEEPDREGQKRPRWMIPLLVATACIGSAAGGLVLGIQSAAERPERAPGISADRSSEHLVTSESARPPMDPQIHPYLPLHLKQAANPCHFFKRSQARKIFASNNMGSGTGIECLVTVGNQSLKWTVTGLYSSQDI